MSNRSRSRPPRLRGYRCFRRSRLPEATRLGPVTGGSHLDGFYSKSPFPDSTFRPFRVLRLHCPWQVLVGSGPAGGDGRGFGGLPARPRKRFTELPSTMTRCEAREFIHRSEVCHFREATRFSAPAPSPGKLPARWRTEGERSGPSSEMRDRVLTDW